MSAFGIRGSSSHYINQNSLVPGKFRWQRGYGAFSVSESGVRKVFRYIKNQKAHHQRRTFQQEYEEFMDLYGLRKNG